MLLIASEHSCFPASSRARWNLMTYRRLRLITSTLFLLPLVLAACNNKGDSASGDGDGEGDTAGDGDGEGDGEGDGDSGDGDAAGGNSGDGDESGGEPGDGDGDVSGDGGNPGGGGGSGGSGGIPDGGGGEPSYGGEPNTGGSASEAAPPDDCSTEQTGTCATDCGQSAGPCDTHYTCSGLVLYNGAWPPQIRIPSASELCESTEAACPWGSPTALRLLDQSVRIFIPEDWSALLVTYDESNDENLATTCAAPKVEGCIAVPDTSESPVVLFFPKGSDSGARNLVIESSDTPLECP